MERAFIFNNFNTYYDWGLILTEKNISYPEPKTNYIELDGMSGSLDLTEALSGEVEYRDRQISATFWTCNGNRRERETLLRNITALLHGRKIKIIEPDNPTHYFYGRVTVTPSVSNLAYLEFNIEAICEPWRYAIDETARYVEVNNNDVSVIINNRGVKTLCPEITVVGSVTITNGDVSTTLTTGTYKITTIKLKSGVNTIDVSGYGKVTIKYREAEF